MMKMTFRTPALILAVACISASSALGATIVAQYNLGEDDGFVFAGGAGADPTVDAVGSNDLTKLGDPTYSGDTPGGSSTLSMEFDGDGDYYSGPVVPSALDVTNYIALSFDAKGSDGAGGFSFLASLGSNFGGLSVVEIGGTVSAFMPGTGGATSGAGFDLDGDSNWHHYDLVWDPNAGTSGELTLSVDSILVSTNTKTPAGGGTLRNALTIGGNSRSDDPVGAPAVPPFEGSFNGLIDNVVLSVREIPEPGSIVLLGMCSAVCALFARRRV